MVGKHHSPLIRPVAAQNRHWAVRVDPPLDGAVRVGPPLDLAVGIRNWNWDRLQGESKRVPENQARAQGMAQIVSMAGGERLAKRRLLLRPGCVTDRAAESIWMNRMGNRYLRTRTHMLCFRLR